MSAFAFPIAGMLRLSITNHISSYIAKPFQGRELVARVHLQMQLGKRRAELEVSWIPSVPCHERIIFVLGTFWLSISFIVHRLRLTFINNRERQREIQILSDHSPIGIVRCVHLNLDAMSVTHWSLFEEPIQLEGREIISCVFFDTNMVFVRIIYVNPRWFELTGRVDLPLDTWYITYSIFISFSLTGFSTLGWIGTSIKIPCHSTDDIVRSIVFIPTMSITYLACGKKCQKNVTEYLWNSVCLVWGW